MITDYSPYRRAMLTRMNDISRMRLFIVDLRVTNKNCCHLLTRSIGRQPVRLCRSLLYIFARRLSTPIRVFTFCQRNLGHRFQRNRFHVVRYRCDLSLPEETMVPVAFRIYEPKKKWDAISFKREVLCFPILLYKNKEHQCLTRDLKKD